jgi:hypothetical protein
MWVPPEKISPVFVRSDSEMSDLPKEFGLVIAIR